MQIDAYATDQLSGVFGVDSITTRQNKKSIAPIHTESGDTVSFSEEALALAKMFMEKKIEQEKRLNAEDASQAEEASNKLHESIRGIIAPYSAASSAASGSPAAGAAPANGAASAGNSGGAGGASQSETELEKIEKQIEELEKKLAAVYASEIPEETKDGVAGGIRAQIAALAAQKNSLTQAKAKGA